MLWNANEQCTGRDKARYSWSNRCYKQSIVLFRTKFLLFCLCWRSQLRSNAVPKIKPGYVQVLQLPENSCSLSCHYMLFPQASFPPLYKPSLGAGRPQWSHLRAFSFHAEQSQFFKGELLQPSDHLCGLLGAHSHRSISLWWGLQRWTQSYRWHPRRAIQRENSKGKENLLDFIYLELEWLPGRKCWVGLEDKAGTVGRCVPSPVHCPVADIKTDAAFFLLGNTEVHPCSAELELHFTILDKSMVF